MKRLHTTSLLALGLHLSGWHLAALAEPMLKTELEQPVTTAQALEETEADSPEATVPVFDLQQITVTGTRTPRTVNNSSSTITVIEQEELKQNLVEDIRDLVRYEPGISVRDNLRYGFQDFNIRGLEGNRVLIQVDGIRQPERFEFGPFQLGRDSFELETLKTVEIIRGPASSLYGSDALGGAVTFTTLDPADLLALTGRDTYLGFSNQATGRNTGFTNTLAMAGRQDRLEALLMYTRRDFQETRIFAGNSTFNNPQEGYGNNVLAKVVYRLSENSDLKLTGEYFNRNTDTTTLPINLGSGILNFDETIDTERIRISLEYTYDNPDGKIFQVATAKAYYQPATTSETSFDENRILQSGAQVSRDTVNELISDLWGADLQFQTNFQTGSLFHRVVYGIDWSVTRNDRPRDRILTDLATGEQTRTIPPDTFPTKDFPESDTTRLGLYLQDEIEWGNGNLTLIPGIRYDIYDLNPLNDPVFAANGSEATSLYADAVSPKLGLIWNLSSDLTFVAQYARGFRAPQYNEVNSGFTNLTSGFFRYRTLSNPDLKPETSDSFEVGLRGVFPQASFSLTGFYNTYDDFIEAFVQVGTEPSPPGTGIPGGPPAPEVNLFQSQNVSRARIYGIEATGEYYFSPDLTGWSLNTSLAWAVGDNLTDDEPLATINPFEAVVGLHYDDPGDKWGTRLIATFVGEPRVPPREGPRDPDPPAPLPFIPNSFTVVDLLGYYNLNDELSLNFGIFNVFDSEYYRYSDVRFLNQGPDVARFAQPGTHASVNLVSRF